MLEAEMTSELTERLRVATYNVHGCVGMGCWNVLAAEGRGAELGKRSINSGAVFE